MDFELDDDERALQDGIRTFLAARSPIGAVREVEDAGGRLDRSLWSELGAIGVFSLRHDGFGMTESVLAFEELGRALVPGPLVATHLADHVAGDLAGGREVVGLVEPSEPVTVVEHLDSLDLLIVLRDDGIEAVDPAVVEGRRSERPLDAATPITVVDQVPSGERIGDAALADRWRRDGMVLTAAIQTGICWATVELGRRYAMEREQFGRPIGSFQAVKHMLADMLTRAEVARAAVYAAAVTIDGRAGRDDPLQAAHAAKLLAGDAALFCAKTCIQIHGGMGFTWEVDAQRFWKRACVLDTHFGNSDHHAAAYAAAM